ncbi:MAG: glycosyltransferase [Bacteroidales bacterium]|nr:glycosyltransferase [Bacteroidales bacterium]
MEQTPLFSVLIANYNNGCYLQEAIDSVLAQDYKNWEIVIVDDKSTDSSSEIYDRYKDDDRFHVYYNELNFGAGYTKHKCAEMAKGEICGFVDPDDKLAVSDALSTMVNTHLQNPDVSMVYSGYYQTDENLAVKKEVHGTVVAQGTSSLESCTWPFKHFVSFKKAAYDRTVGVDTLMKRAVDYDMYYKLEEVGKIMHIDRLLYTYRKNPHSISLNEGEYKSRVWHSYACVEAMKRRGLTDERLMLFPIEDTLKRAYEKCLKCGKQTRTYKVGNAVLSPVKWIRRWL